MNDDQVYILKYQHNTCCTVTLAMQYMILKQVLHAILPYITNA